MMPGRNMTACSMALECPARSYETSPRSADLMRWRSGASAPRGEPSRSRLGASHNQPSDEQEAAPMDRQYVGIDFHRRRSVIVRVSAAGEKLSGVRVANDALAMAGAGGGAGPGPRGGGGAPLRGDLG